MITTVKFKPDAWMLLRGYWALGARRLFLHSSVVLAITGFLLYMGIGTSDYSLILTVCLSLLVLYVCSRTLFPWLRYRSVLKTPAFSGEWTITVADADILFCSEHVETKYQWSALVKLVETSEMFILSFGKAGMMLAPKNAFASPEDISSFRELVDRKIAKDDDRALNRG